MAISAKVKNTKPHAASYIIMNPAKELDDPTLTFFETEDGEPIQGILKMVGRSSKEFRDYFDSIQSDFAQYDPTEVLASMVVGWEENGFFDVPYSKEAALELVKDENNKWLMDQLAAFNNKASNFF